MKRGLVLALESEGPERIAAISAAREQKAGPRGAPSETEYLDLLDGTVAVLCRNARKAARAAARESGQPSIEQELQLRELYGSRKRRMSAADPEHP